MNEQNTYDDLSEKTHKDRLKEDQNELVISYITLRKLIGWCGIFLPIIIAIIWHDNPCYHNFMPSISDYFYTPAGDIFVIVLSAVGLFLFTYNGYETFEKILLKTAAVCAILVPLVPCDPACHAKGTACTDCGYPLHNVCYRGFLGFLSSTFHLAFAAIFLLCLAIISIKYFTKTDDKSKLRKQGKLTQKGKRNIVYKVCGYTIIASLICLALLMGYEKLYDHPLFPGVPVIYIFETISVWAFGISWLTKGETLLPDEPEVKKHRNNPNYHRVG